MARPAGGTGLNDKPIRVVVADDQRVVRDGLAMLVGLMDGVEVVATACDGFEAIECVERDRPDIVLMDPSRRPSADAESLPDGLTPREAEVLKLIAAGLSNAEIAAALVVSDATVKTHINHVFSKTGARDRAQTVRYAYQRGFA